MIPHHSRQVSLQQPILCSLMAGFACFIMQTCKNSIHLTSSRQALPSLSELPSLWPLDFLWPKKASGMEALDIMTTWLDGLASVRGKVNIADLKRIFFGPANQRQLCLCYDNGNIIKAFKLQVLVDSLRITSGLQAMNWDMKDKFWSRRRWAWCWLMGWTFVGIKKVNVGVLRQLCPSAPADKTSDHALPE